MNVDNPAKRLEEAASEYLSAKEAARLLGIHPQTLSTYARSGRIHAGKTPGGQRRYHISVLQAVLDGRLEDAARPPEPLSGRR